MGQNIADMLAYLFVPCLKPVSFPPEVTAPGSDFLCASENFYHGSMYP